MRNVQLVQSGRVTSMRRERPTKIRRARTGSDQYDLGFQHGVMVMSVVWVLKLVVELVKVFL